MRFRRSSHERASEISKAEQFAWVMKKIPRRPLRDEIYGTVQAIVDQRHARNIILKAVPTATSTDIHHALVILQDRLDDSFDRPAYR